MAFSQRRGLCRKAAGDIRMPRKPLYRGWMMPSTRPISWKCGSHDSEMLCEECSKPLAMAAELDKTLSWPTITPLGVAVEPDVYCKYASASVFNSARRHS